LRGGLRNGFGGGLYLRHNGRLRHRNRLLCHLHNDSPTGRAGGNQKNDMQQFHLTPPLPKVTLPGAIAFRPAWL
jgi:hypothetical protein